MTQGQEGEDPLIHEIRSVLAEVDELIDEAIREVASVERGANAQTRITGRNGMPGRRTEEIEPLPSEFAPPLHTMSEVGNRLGALAERLEQSLRRPRQKASRAAVAGTRDQQKESIEPRKLGGGRTE